MNLDELRQDKGRLVTQMRAINDKAATEKRAFTPDEDEKYKAMEADLDRITASIAREEALAKAHRENATGPGGIRAVIDTGDNPTRPNEGDEYKRNFRAYLRGGDARTPISITATLVKSTGTQVGYLVPTDYETEIRKNIYPLNVMRRLATVTTTTSDSVIPMEGSLPTFGWIDELGTYPTTDLTVGRLGFGAHKLGGILTASEEIIADAFTDLPAYISDRSKVAIAATEESAFTIGDGNLKPTGVAGSATLGLTTAATTTFTSDELLTFMDSLDQGYVPNAQLLVTKTWRSMVRKMKDSTGQYLWQPGLQAGVPDILNGKVVNISSYLAVPAAGAIAALYGDFSYYQILDRQGFYMRQLNELYAPNGQVGFQINERVDGKLLQPLAIRTMKMAAS